MTLLAPAGLGSGGGCGFGIEPVAAKRLMTRAMRTASESPAASAGGSGYKDLRRSMPAGPTSVVHVSGFSPFEREFLVHATEAAASLSWERVLPVGGVTPASRRKRSILGLVDSCGILSAPQRTTNVWGTAIGCRRVDSVGTLSPQPSCRSESGLNEKGLNEPRPRC